MRTNEIVIPRDFEQGQQLRRLVREGVTPRLLIARDEAGAARPDVRSYTAALRDRMRRVHESAGWMVTQEVTLDELVPVVTANSQDLEHIVGGAAADPTVDSIIVMSPTTANYEDIVAKIGPGKDVDGMNPDSGRMPCTPRAVQNALDHYGLWNPDLSYTLVGRGRTVGSHVDGLLRELHGDNYDEQVSVISARNSDELPAAMAASQVAIVAAGVRHQIEPSMIHANTLGVAGVCIQDIHPDVYTLPGDIRVTPVHLDKQNWGIGVNTSSLAVQGVLDAAALRLPR